MLIRLLKIGFPCWCILISGQGLYAQNRFLSPSLGLSAIQVSGQKLLPGAYGSMEMGGNRFKLAVELQASLSKAPAENQYMTAVSQSGQPSVDIPVYVKRGYSTMVFSGRCYLAENFYARKSNIFGEAGLVVQRFLFAMEQGSYDASQYIVSQSELDAHPAQKSEKRYGLTIAVGYQYNLAENFGIVSRLGYDIGFSSENKAKVMSLALGFKYHFAWQVNQSPKLK